MPAAISVSAPPDWLDLLSVQQDWLWFLALLGWSLALVAWWRSPRRHSAWAWLPWAAGAGVLTALVQFMIFDPPFGFFFDRLVPGTSSVYVPAPVDPNLLGDLLLALVAAGTTAAWWWRQLAPRPNRWLRGPVALALAAVVAVHIHRPDLSSWALALLPLPGVIALLRRPDQRFWSRLALILSGLLPALSTVGPLAVALGLLQRSGPPSALGALAAAVQALAAGAVLAGLVRESLAALTAGPRRELARDRRPFVLAALAALAIGGLFAIRTGADNRREVMINRLRLVASEANTFRRENVAPLVAPAFHLDRFSTAHRPPRRAFSTHLARERAAGRAARDALASLVAATPFLERARFVTLRDGWLVAVADNEPPGPPGTVELLHPETAADRAAWDHRQAWIEQPAKREMGQPYYCRAPLLGADGRMLGWLEFVRAEFYSTTERKWRAQPLLVTALGIVLSALLFAQRRTAREREAVNRAAAVAAESNRIKTAFLAKVSHELRTPLQGILGYCELLQRDLTDDTALTRLAALHSHGELMTRLVNDLLDLGAIEAGSFRFVLRPVPLPELVRQTVESLRPRAAAKGLALACTIAPDVPAWVASDAERLRQILLNLLGNALKFTDAGRVDVALSVRARQAQSCEIELAVTDTGPGIAPADQARIFEPFSRLDLAAPKEGAGLGLALISAMCRGTGGDVTVESDGAHGSCFRARLRLDLAAAPVETAAPAAVALDGRRILIADDNPLVRELFASYVRGLGATCDAVADGEAAVARATAERYDAIVLDLAMPRLEGPAVARRLRTQGASMRSRIVGVSAHAKPRDRDQALTAGMDAFLTKPVELPEFAAALVADAAPAAVRPAPAGDLTARLARMFRGEAEPQAAALAAAVERSDWTVAAQRAHWFKNSAAVVQDETLFAACVALEDAAERKQAAALAAAWDRVRESLTRWRAGPPAPAA